MEKPVIFFSHSSKDKEFLILLKNKIIKKTSNSIEIFQSSDGESIPFGNNWVHKIEDNLKNSKLMFVFVSPNSLKSNWIYFESGFSYSKGVKVIPIGINGIDIGKLAPPINLLQGFNITSHEGLNNLISIINKEFIYSFIEDFSFDDYEELLSKSNNFINNNHYFDYIDFVETSFIKNLRDNKLKETAYDDINIFLNKEKIKNSKDGNGRIYLHGMLISKEKDEIVIRIDHVKLIENVTILNKILRIVYESELEKYWIFINFLENIELLTTNFKLSSRLNNVGIEMSEINGTLYVYKNLLFALDDLSKGQFNKREGKRLRIVYTLDSFKESDLFELINILFDQKIIWLK